MDVSVIIPSYNGARTLRDCILAIVAQEWDRPWEIILADNGSTDESVSIFLGLAEQYTHISMWVVDASAKRGKAAALNLAIRRARGRAILLTDDDDLVAPGWLAAMGEALDAADLVGASLDLRRLNPDWAIEYRYPDPRLWDNPVEACGTRYQPGFRYQAGTAMGFTRRLFDEVGGYNPDSFADDLDFCLRALRSGHVLQPVPDAMVHYRLRRDPASTRRQLFNYAKAQVQVSRDFPEFSEPPSTRWRSFLATTRGLASGTTRHVLARGWRDRAARARLEAAWSQYVGYIAGMATFRTMPP